MDDPLLLDLGQHEFGTLHAGFSSERYLRSDQNQDLSHEESFACKKSEFSDQCTTMPVANGYLPQLLSFVALWHTAMGCPMFQERLPLKS
jgi:hypothetical protein